MEKYEAVEQRENPLYWQAAKLAGFARGWAGRLREVGRLAHGLAG